MPSEYRVSNLRCEYLVDPQGLDEREPRLYWQIESDRRGARQLSWRVRVASSAEALEREGNRWDSGKQAGGDSTHIIYRGEPLRSRERCYWNVESWDETGASAVSATAVWTMGLLEVTEWQAQWITGDDDIYVRDPGAVRGTLTRPGTPVIFRRDFIVPEEVRSATLYASARGIFELRLGGETVGRDKFAPEWTDYSKRIHYRTYDVTEGVAEGMNRLEATLGDGWWSGFVGWQEMRGRYGSLENSLLVQLEVELKSGGRMVVASGDSWECGTGPILSSDFMMGEIYDARRHPGAWGSARVVAPPSGSLVAQRSEPVQITEELAARSVVEIEPGRFIYDLGQNITGWVRLELTAADGTRVRIRHAERLNPDGTIYTENLRRAKATDYYICRGGGPETFEPHFTFHGFQYIELTAEEAGGGEGTQRDFHVGLEAVTGCVIHSATPSAGHFECSHPAVNRLWLNGLWSQRDNFLSVPTDCPQRDERLGWMGDAQVFLRTASYNMDVAAFFTKWMIDVEDAQTPGGVFPDVAPRVPEDINFVGLDQLQGAAGWADAGVIVPWTIWRVYGDRRIVERHWRAMTAWLDWLEKTNPSGLRVNELYNNYGDWLCIPSDTTFRTHSEMKNLLATAYWADDAAKMAVMARALGRDSEAARYEAMFDRVRAAFQREYIEEGGRLRVETQTAYLLALAFDLLPAASRTRAADRLVDNIRDLDWHLSTGFIGISHLNPTLTLEGRVDVAYRLLLREDYPSWLYPVQHGATTIWERWNGWTKQDGFFNPQMNSFNHYSLGSVGEWLFRHVAGIEMDAAEPGFQHFILKPFIGPGLSFARASYRTLHGTIESHWRRDGNRLTWSVRIPANTRATIYIPSDGVSPVEADGLPIVRRGEGFAVYQGDAGQYTFTSVCSPHEAAAENR